MIAILLTFLAPTAWAAPAKLDPTPEELGVIMAPDAGSSLRSSEANGQGSAGPAGSPRTPKRAAEAPPAAGAARPQACPADDAIFLPTGFTFPALLPDAIYSYNTKAPVIALLEDDVRFRDRVVLPRATRLVGNASALHTLDRVNIVWELAVLPEGCEFNFPGIALSAEDGSGGIKGKAERHEDAVAAHIALKSMLGAANAAATFVSPVEGALASGFSNEAAQTLDQSMGKVKSLESIYIRERTPIRVFVLRRFVRTASQP